MKPSGWLTTKVTCWFVSAKKSWQRRVGNSLCHSKQVLLFYHTETSRVSAVAYLPSLLTTASVPCCHVLGRESGCCASKPQWPFSKCITRVPNSLEGLVLSPCLFCWWKSNSKEALVILTKKYTSVAFIPEIKSRGNIHWHIVAMSNIHFFPGFYTIL